MTKEHEASTSSGAGELDAWLRSEATRRRHERLAEYIRGTEADAAPAAEKYHTYWNAPLNERDKMEVPLAAGLADLRSSGKLEGLREAWRIVTGEEWQSENQRALPWPPPA